MPRSNSKQQKQAATPEIPTRSFIVTATGNNCKIENESFSDFEMLGILRALTLAYERQFNINGGGSNDNEKTS